jgi:hypothetical protein
VSKDHLADAIRAALTTGTGMIQSTFRRKSLELPAPPINPCKEIQFPPTPQNPYLVDHLHIDPARMFHMNTPVSQKTAAEVLAKQRQIEAFRAKLQKQEAEQAMASRFRASKDPMLKHLKALLEELAPTQLLLQSPHYTALAQLIEQIEKPPTSTLGSNAYGAAMSQAFKENFTG